MDFKLKPKCPSIDSASAQMGQGRGQGPQKGQNRFFRHKIFNYHPMDSFFLYIFPFPSNFKLFVHNLLSIVG